MMSSGWTPEEDRRLILGREAGLTYKQIVDLCLPGKSEESCSNRLGRLGLRPTLRGPSEVAASADPIPVTKQEVEWRRKAREGSRRYYDAVEAYLQKCRAA